MAEKKWAKFSDESLLNVRIKDLDLKIEGTNLEKYVDELYSNLESKNLIFKPPVYLADEWLCPDEEPIIGIPFYLAHPRLKKLEKRMILEVEGGTKREFMKLIRHEAGHAYNYAYRLFRRKKWSELFGSFDEDYPETYIPRPYSRKYVRHIENCYAQYHPDEDFAETFAVWLTPGSNWKEVYKGWKGAMAKLQYVDSVMKKLQGKKPPVTSNKKYWSAKKMTRTLGSYYKKKRREYAEDLPGFFDPDLKRIFKKVENCKAQESAADFIKAHQREMVESVSMWTGKNKYVINRVINELIDTAKRLRLKRYCDRESVLLVLTSYVNSLVMNYLFTGRLKEFP